MTNTLAEQATYTAKSRQSTCALSSRMNIFHTEKAARTKAQHGQGGCRMEGDPGNRDGKAIVKEKHRGQVRIGVPTATERNALVSSSSVCSSSVHLGADDPMRGNHLAQRNRWRHQHGNHSTTKNKNGTQRAYNVPDGPCPLRCFRETSPFSI